MANEQTILVLTRLGQTNYYFGVDPVKGKPTDYFWIDKEITHFLILINQRFKLWILWIYSHFNLIINCYYNYCGLTNSLILEIDIRNYKLYELTNLCVDTFSMCLSQVHNEQGWHGGARILIKAINFPIIRKLI